MKVVNFVIALFALLVTISIITNNVLISSNAEIQNELGAVQQIAQTAPGKREALIRLANRVNQDAPLDPKLRELLTSLQITVNPTPAK
ncbi:hypothetical protein SAMN05444156_3049 [Verrucomicrobium sp. GAS474]|uniref:hypothetical protein n=1 Tax=Verrucomicrobium sp. GAS474 TaxID=1882831 RepID=UPI00087CABF1|nr:hypothetical protein [Verrucomicrobium sp. GAS474]SDU28286.1 hypothetical protein SAMN05444156_3049 [Verrucomicrobium sp. GAS474]